MQHTPVINLWDPPSSVNRKLLSIASVVFLRMMRESPDVRYTSRSESGIVVDYFGRVWYSREQYPDGC